MLLVKSYDTLGTLTIRTPFDVYGAAAARLAARPAGEAAETQQMLRINVSALHTEENAGRCWACLVYCGGE